MSNLATAPVKLGIATGGYYANGYPPVAQVAEDYVYGPNSDYTGTLGTSLTGSVSIASGEFIRVVRDAIAANGELAAGLGTHDFGDGTYRPSISLTDPAPPTMQAPLVVLTESDAGDFATRGKRGTITNITVRLWGNNDESNQPLRELANVIWGLFDRAELSVDGWNVFGTTASRPQSTSGADGFPGFMIDVFVRALED